MRCAVIDAHAHCGRQERYPPQAIEDYYAAVQGSDILGVVVFPPVLEIYDRYDPAFEDSPQWREGRRKANEYLLTLEGYGLAVFPFFFIWNDFAVDQLTPAHRGIKWHRHGDEPRYHYDDPRCQRAIEGIRQRNLPVCTTSRDSHVTSSKGCTPSVVYTRSNRTLGTTRGRPSPRTFASDVRGLSADARVMRSPDGHPRQGRGGSGLRLLHVLMLLGSARRAQTTCVPPRPQAPDPRRLDLRSTSAPRGSGAALSSAISASKSASDSNER